VTQIREKGKDETREGRSVCETIQKASKAKRQQARHVKYEDRQRGFVTDPPTANSVAGLAAPCECMGSFRTRRLATIRLPASIILLWQNASYALNLGDREISRCTLQRCGRKEEVTASQSWPPSEDY
jgi:hypothetical protein